MQENDAKYVDGYRYAPRRRSVRRIYMGRIVALVSVLCLTVCILLLVFAPSRRGTFEIKQHNYFFVTTASTEYSSDATEKALAIKRAGGAGYILNDGTFRVMAAVYSNEGEAATVAKRLSENGVSATVYELATEKLKFTAHEDKQKNAEIAELFAYPKSVAEKLETLSREYDAAETSEALALLEIENLRASVKKKSALLADSNSDEFTVLKLMYGRFDEAFARCLSAQSRISVRSAIKELSCAIAAENVLATRAS